MQHAYDVGMVFCIPPAGFKKCPAPLLQLHVVFTKKTSPNVVTQCVIMSVPGQILTVDRMGPTDRLVAVPADNLNTRDVDYLAPRPAFLSRHRPVSFGHAGDLLWHSSVNPRLFISPPSALALLTTLVLKVGLISPKSYMAV